MRFKCHTDRLAISLLFEQFFAMILAVLGICLQLLAVHSEEVFFNGSGGFRGNKTTIEVTTVKIAEIVNLKSKTISTTIVLKEKTAKHFVTPTSSKVVLIPPAQIVAQIVRKQHDNVNRDVA